MHNTTIAVCTLDKNTYKRIDLTRRLSKPKVLILSSISQPATTANDESENSWVNKTITWAECDVMMTMMTVCLVAVWKVSRFRDDLMIRLLFMNTTNTNRKYGVILFVQ